VIGGSSSAAHFSRSYCCTQYDRLFAWYGRLSICLQRYAYCGARGRCRGL